MQNLHAQALRYENGVLSILNQQKLPSISEWIPSQSPEEMAHIIYELQVRGAPLIGIAAAVALADFAEKGATLPQLEQAAATLQASRPTAVNLAYCLEKQLQTLRFTQDPKSIVRVAEELFYEDRKLCEQIAKNGSPLFQDGDAILTHCNTGALVTAGIGTALGVLREVHRAEKSIHVFVDETRPLLQGARLTAWELDQEGIPYTLICDSMAATLMKQGKVQKIILGADRIARNGDFANKIGTYNLAVLAYHHKIPFYVAAPYTTVDSNCASGDEIMIEERSGAEVRGVSGAFGKCMWTLPECNVYNPSFDVTPSHLVTKFILDSGVFSPDELVIFQ